MGTHKIVFTLTDEQIHRTLGALSGAASLSVGGTRLLSTSDRKALGELADVIAQARVEIRGETRGDGGSR